MSLPLNPVNPLNPQNLLSLRLRPLCAALSAALLMSALLSACGGGDDATLAAPSDTAYTVPAAPAGLGRTDTAPLADASVLAFVDTAATNQRGDARYATLATNAGVRVVGGFLDVWQPSSLIVDAGVTAPANGSFPAVVASTWSGIPGDATDGKVLNASVHAANIQYVIDATGRRTAAQTLAAYLDDRRGKGYSVSDGMGPLTDAWRSAARQTTSITAIAADSTTVLYNDTGNNTGVGSAAGNTGFGTVVDFVNGIGENGSTEPAKRFYKYARPWRWSSSVQVVPALEPAKSTTPATDGGFISGHSAEATRDAVAMAYVAPQRFQEMLARGLELGENRIYAGMHSPLDVIGGRVHGQALATAAIATGSNAAIRAAAYAQAQAALMAAAGVSSAADLNTFAHSQTTATDRFADHAAAKADYRRRLTYGFTQIADRSKAATVPKGAEILLETRLPYLTADQRRIVLKTTALPSGFPVLDDAEGWGRLNLFDAADGYGAFNGDVSVSMDASLGGFSAFDQWRNDITGAGKLTKLGTGTLALTGTNLYTGGTEVQAGVLRADSAQALGTGDVFVRGGTLASRADSALVVGGAYTQLGSATLQLNLGSGDAGRLIVKGTAIVDNGSLVVQYRSGSAPAVDDTIQVISAGQWRGRFASITLDGHKVTPIYSDTGLTLRIDS